MPRDSSHYLVERETPRGTHHPAWAARDRLPAHRLPLAFGHHWLHLAAAPPGLAVDSAVEDRGLAQEKEIKDRGLAQEKEKYVQAGW